jgi:uncharacterized membrane protein YphA (DoxX/SURF4 family)
LEAALLQAIKIASYSSRVSHAGLDAADTEKYRYIMRDSIGYPQQLRVILGIAKLVGAITLVVPGLAKLKEWAYAGFTFAWISAFVAHYLAKDGPKAFMPLILLLLLVISYVTRPAGRQWQAIQTKS